MAALECRSETGTVLTTATFDSKQMNRAVLVEFALAVLVTQMDVFHRLLDTTQINLAQFGWALVPALALLVLWEVGKLVARRLRAPGTTRSRHRPRPARRPRSPRRGRSRRCRRRASGRDLGLLPQVMSTAIFSCPGRGVIAASKAACTSPTGWTWLT